MRHPDPRELHQRSDSRSPGYDHVPMMGCLKMFYALPHFVAHSIRPCVVFTVIWPAAFLIRQHRTSRPAFAVHGGCINFWSGVLRRVRDSSQFGLPVAPTSTQLLRSTECRDARALPASMILLVKSLFQVYPPLSVTSPLRLISWRRKIGAQCYCCSSTVPMSGWLQVENGRRGVVPSHRGGAFLSAT